VIGQDFLLRLALDGLDYVLDDPHDGTDTLHDFRIPEVRDHVQEAAKIKEMVRCDVLFLE
jgi:hypothetical protein